MLACGTAGTSVPTDRGLLILGIGGCVLIAELLLWTRREGASRGERIVGRVLLVMHLVISPLIMPLRVMTTPMLQSRIDEISAAFPDEPGVQQRTVILLNAPSDLVMFYSRAQAQLQGRGFPGRVSYLYAGTGGLDVKSIEPHVLEVTADRPWLATPLDRMFRADATFEQGQSIQAPCLTASILEVLSRRSSYGRCDVSYDPSVNRTQVELLARDCQAHLESLERYFETRGPARVHVLLFANAQQKGHDKGAGADGPVHGLMAPLAAGAGPE